MLIFYFSPGSSSMATHIALHETGAPFEARPLTLQQGTRAPDFLKVNPNPTRAEMAHGISGNLCRCADYNKILDVMMVAAENMRRA